MQIDLRVVRAKSFGAALQYFIGYTTGEMKHFEPAVFNSARRKGSKKSAISKQL